MKILIVASHLRPSEGWGTEALQSVQGLRALGHDVRALVHQSSDNAPCIEYALLPPPLTVLRNPFAFFRTWRALQKVTSEWKPDVLHIMTEPYALAATFVRRAPLLVLTINGTYALVPLASGITRWLMMRVYHRSCRILSISRYTATRLSERLRELDRDLAASVRKKTVIWTLGTPLLPAPESHQKNPVKQIVFVGALKARKGIREIIEACGAFKKTSRMPFHLHLLGSPPEKDYGCLLTQRIQALGLTNSVTLHGHVSDAVLAEKYAEADLFIMLSISEGMHFEGYGLVFLEANMRGVPVIGPKDSGCEDAISDGRSGYLVNPHVPDEVAQCMRWILEEDRIQSGECRAWAEEHNIQRQAKELETVYQDVIQERA